ncbi:hypothetical protein [Halarcobacter sp.]|uniref:hypothetical protein n=1 Tax=Halarcobacter sp. TaxID=2321133 RepID=UPI002AA82B3A|nr:hypothetical protein [Halarcobacter sp.]
MKNNFINNLNILVIDDEELIREKIETIFLKLFAKVFVAETGLSGLKIIRDEIYCR